LFNYHQRLSVRIAIGVSHGVTIHG
jgi:hypothetical protein